MSLGLFLNAQAQFTRPNPTAKFKYSKQALADTRQAVNQRWHFSFWSFQITSSRAVLTEVQASISYPNSTHISTLVLVSSSNRLLLLLYNFQQHLFLLFHWVIFTNTWWAIIWRCFIVLYWANNIWFFFLFWANLCFGSNSLKLYSFKCCIMSSKMGRSANA